MSMLMKIVLGLAAVIALGSGVLWLVRGPLVSYASPAPKTLGLQNGRLSACPATSRNCVSSYDSHAYAQMDAVPYLGTMADAQARVVKVLLGLGNATLVSQQPGYVHAIARTPMWGFIDDVQVVIADGKIHFKSEARLGQGDMGANRARMEKVMAGLRG